MILNHFRVRKIVLNRILTFNYENINFTCDTNFAPFVLSLTTVANPATPSFGSSTDVSLSRYPFSPKFRSHFR